VLVRARQTRGAHAHPHPPAYNARIPAQRAPFNSHGQEVFYNGKSYITPDIDQHNVVGWKMFDRTGRRIGTYDLDLNYVKP
jgi:Novel toxin 21